MRRLTLGLMALAGAVLIAACDDASGGDDGVTTALQNYVDDGGNMYFSDLSDSWLTPVFPDLVTFPADKNSTNAGTLTDMEVVDSGLQIFLGSSAIPQTTVDLVFDFGVWTAMDSVVDIWRNTGKR